MRDSRFSSDTTVRSLLFDNRKYTNYRHKKYLSLSLFVAVRIEFVGRDSDLANVLVLTGSDVIVVDVRICDREAAAAAASFSRSGIDRRDGTRSLL